MKKIGFIDYYLDEWHANNYPVWINEISQGEFRVAYAYSMTDSPLSGGMTTDQWCSKHQIGRCQTQEDLVAKSDVIIILSPDNCEKHEELCQVALRSGKRTYIDKTFAPDKASAQRIFSIAKEFGTPCYSTSALRFAAEYQTIPVHEITALNSFGPGDFDTYSIHQLEPIIMLMKAPARRVMAMTAENYVFLLIEFNDSRIATMSQYLKGSPFSMNICCRNGNNSIKPVSDYFKNFIIEMIVFFQTGSSIVQTDETIEIMAVREAGIKALTVPGQWIQV